MGSSVVRWGTVEGLLKKNEHRTSNVECENMKKQSLKPELLDDILQ